MTHPPRNKNKIFMISLYLGLRIETNLAHENCQNQRSIKPLIPPTIYSISRSVTYGPEGKHNPTLNKDSLTPFT